MKKPTYIEIVHPAPPLIRFEAFIGFYKVLGSGLKQANQPQPPEVWVAGIACEEIVKIAQRQLGEVFEIIGSDDCERTVRPVTHARGPAAN